MIKNQIKKFHPLILLKIWREIVFKRDVTFLQQPDAVVV